MVDDDSSEPGNEREAKLWIIAPILKRAEEITDSTLSQVKEIVERNRYALLKNHYLVLHDYTTLVNTILKRVLFLNPCPICNKRARIIIEPEILNYDIMVACTNCGLFAGPVSSNKAMGILLLDAISIWNTYSQEEGYTSDMFIKPEVDTTNPY